MFERRGLLLALCLIAWLQVRTLRGADKNGVSPQVISLPSGPGSIQGLGESFQPQLNTGGASYSVTIEVPSGPAGHAPIVSLQYHSGNGNGCVGVGWKLAGPSRVSRNIDEGLPLYVDGPNGLDDDFDGAVDNPEEIDRFVGMDMEELVPLLDDSFRSETESTFVRYERMKAAGWQARVKNGTRLEFGRDASARIENGGREFAWLLQRVVDLNGNATEYRYITHPDSPGQKYCREIRWARPERFYAMVMSYDEDRPDVYSDFRSGFETRTGLRLSRIDVIAQGTPPSATALVGDFNEDGQPDSLIRRYELEYHSDATVSLLRRITLLGADGVTALPPLTFEYTRWQPLDNAASAITLSNGDPVAALDSTNVELIDMNRDALPDLLEATQSAHRVYLNRGLDDEGRLAWDTAGALVSNAPGLNLGATAVHLADHTADGEADLVHKVNDSTFQCFINTGQRAWSTPVNLTTTDTFPRWPFEDLGSRTLDTDHNRLSDILATGDNSFRLWMLLPGGRYGREVALPVLSDGTQAFQFDDPGARIADVNGDRISDLAWVQSTRVVYWASCGRGNFEGPIVLPLTASLSTDEIARTNFADVNGDAVADLVVVRPAASPNGVHYWVNLGNAGFDARRNILGLPSAQPGDTVRCADMNGNGSVDLLISNSARPLGTREQFLDFVPGVRPHLLIRADNGLGLITKLDYETSVDQMVRAREAGKPWSATMPISIPVVARITEDDSRGNAYIREIAYRDPFYDPQKQEFRGFTSAQVTEPGDASAATTVTVSRFDTGASNDCLKGTLLATDVTNGGKALSIRTEQSWQARILESGVDNRDVCFPFTENIEMHVFEGKPSSVLLRKELTYDDFGNVVHEKDYGIAGQPGDELFVERTFDYHEDLWLLDRPSRQTTTDGNGVRKAEALFTYDDQGNLLEQRRWLDTEDRFVSAIRNAYDSFGNVTRITDANGHSRSIAYDSLLHTYPTSETIHLEAHNLTMTAAYIFSFGAVTSYTDFASAETTYGYDALGRLTAIEKPGGARTTYEYELGSPISRVITRQLETAGGATYDAHDYADGYGRPLGSKVEAEDGRWRFLDAVRYNAHKLAGTEWLPYITETSDYEEPDPVQAHHSLTYDVRGRLIRTTGPDGSRTTTIYAPLMEHLADENDNAGAGTPMTRRFDGMGRLIEVTERNAAESYTSVYTWSTLGDLTSFVDAQGNRKTYEYDSLRRRTKIRDPDRGTVTLYYDDVGNTIRSTDAKAQAIEYTYDFANRLLTENYLDQNGEPDDPIDVTYRYDIPSTDLAFGDGTSGSATFTEGRLAAAIDLSGEEHLSYDARGNLVWNVRRILDPHLLVKAPFTTRFDHDLMDRVTDIYYPDNDHCRNTLSDASFVERIDGGPGGLVIVEDLDYEPTGQLARIVLGNGLETRYTYDIRDRLTALVTAPPSGDAVADYSYAYDPVSNLTAITDRRDVTAIPLTSPRRNTQLFSYDDLYRLTRVRYAPGKDGTPTLGQIDYVYDRIGNLVHQSCPPKGQPGYIPDDIPVNLGTMSYGGPAGSSGRNARIPGDPPGPHALTATASGQVYGYDDNGNATSRNGASLTWDFKDRLVRHRDMATDVRQTYDYTDRRIVKLASGAEGTTQTWFINQYFEVRPNHAPIKYVFNGSTRVARIKGMLDPQRPRVQRFWLAANWNLVSVAVETSQTGAEIFGPDVMIYRPAGGTYEPVGIQDALPIGQPLWVHAPNPRIVAAVGSYEMDPQPQDIEAGMRLVAFARLEPLVPSVHLDGAHRIHAFDASVQSWNTVDGALPSFLTMERASLESSGSFWLFSGTPLTFDRNPQPATDVVYFHTDHLGSNQTTTDRQGQVLQETVSYPFGLPRSRHRKTDSPELYGDFLFIDKELEEETGLYDFDARFYDPVVGHFLSTDPLELDQRAEAPAGVRLPVKHNLYAYSGNNPVKYVDPDGNDFEVAGPRAAEFVDLVSEYSGLPLRLEGDEVVVDKDGLLDPFASPTLQNLVFDSINSENQVRVTAFGGKNRGFLGDTFHGQPGVYPARSVFVRDLTDIEEHSPILARGVLGHILGEYYSAARPPGAKLARAFSDHHVAGLRAEGAVVGDLTGREVFSGRSRPWEEVDPAKNTAIRHYGKNLRYRIVLYPGTTLVKTVIAPKGLKE